MDYSSNITGNLTQRAENAYINSTIIKDTLAAKTASVNCLINNLKVGDLFQGRIIDIRNNLVSILLADSNTITAKLPEKMNLNINQEIIFKVKDNTNKQIVIQPYMLDEIPEEVLLKALSNANLKPSESNVQAVKDLVEHKLPIDKQTLGDYTNELSVYGDENKEEILTLHKLNIPVSKENIEQIKNYLTNEHKLATQINKLSNNIVENFRQKDLTLTKDLVMLAGDYLGKNEADIINQIIDGENKLNNFEFNTTKSYIKDLNTVNDHIYVDFDLKQASKINEDVRKEIEVDDKDIMSTNDKAAEVLDRTLNNKLETSRLINDKYLSFNKHPELENIIKNCIEKSLMIDMESLSKEVTGENLKEMIEKLYNNIEEKLDDIQKVFDKDNSEIAEVIKEQINNIKNNVSFVKELNLSSDYSYVQIPLKTYNEYSNGELYVYNKKQSKNTYDTKDKLTAFLHFDLTYLGACDISVILQENSLTASFSIADDKSATLVENHLDELIVAFNKHGFAAKCTVEKVIAEDKEIIDKLIDDNKASKEIKRYSFDVRA